MKYVLPFLMLAALPMAGVAAASEASVVALNAALAKNVEHARSSGAPWLLLEGPPDVRLEAAQAFVDELAGAREFDTKS